MRSFSLRVAYPECKRLITLPGGDEKSGIKWFGPPLKCCFSFNLYHCRQCLSLTDVHEPPSVHFACVYSWSDDPKSLFVVSSTAECLSYWHTYCSTELEQLTCYVIQYTAWPSNMQRKLNSHRLQINRKSSTVLHTSLWINMCQNRLYWVDSSVNYPQSTIFSLY